MRRRARRVAALQHQLGEPVSAARIIGRLRHDVLIDAGGFVVATDGGVKICEHGAAFGAVAVERGESFERLFGAVELFVDEVETGERAARVAVRGFNFDGALELRFGHVLTVLRDEKLGVFQMRERGVVVDGERAFINFFGLRRLVHLAIKKREAQLRFDALRVERDGVVERGQSLFAFAGGVEHGAFEDVAFDVVRVFV